MASEQAARFLDRVHERVWEAFGLTPTPDSPENWEAYRSHADAVLQARTVGLAADTAAAMRDYTHSLLADARSETISKYESRWHLRRLAMAADDLEEASRRHGRPVPERPLLGTLPTGQINAMTLLVPETGEHLVLFESEFTSFTYVAAQAIADVLPYTEHEDGGVTYHINAAEAAERIARQPGTTLRFGEMILAYLKTGRAALAPQRVQEKIPNVYAGTLADSMMKFALGHEYGHIIAGHVGSRRPIAWLGGTGSNGADVEEIVYDDEQELLADGLGMQHMLWAQQPEWGLPFSYCGLDAYFTVMDVLDRAVSLMRYGDEDRTEYLTHRPPSMRRDALRAVLEILAPGEQGKLAIKSAKGLEDIVEMLWNRLRGQFHELHRRGLRPAGILKD